MRYHRWHVDGTVQYHLTTESEIYFQCYFNLRFNTLVSVITKIRETF